jgi:GTP-binding protein
MRFVPVAFITASEEVNVKKLVNLAQAIAKQARTRVPTARLNEVLERIIERNHPPMRSGRRAKIFFATQIATAPPTIVIKCNDPRLIDKGWQRYLLGAFHEELPFQEVPIKIYYRSRTGTEGEAPPDDETSEVVLSGDDPVDLAAE